MRDHATGTRAATVTHIMSVDVEDYFQVEAFADVVPRVTWEQWPSRVVANTHRVFEGLPQRACPPAPTVSY